ncbi:catalase [Dactylosporangium sp. NPDC005555]|uniref:catalase n=1 Tax=Dactylosporangium sp. NPDC005555 TaxID=3154889 RepID=UPI0033A1CFBC
MTSPKLKPTTADAGIPVASDELSLTVGPDGPIVLNDHYLIEQMANFNRERIPERQPHAKGGGAFGHFEVTGDVSAYTRAAVFQPGTRTDTLSRFSTVAGERGSPDTWRDPQGGKRNTANALVEPASVEIPVQAVAVVRAVSG